MELHTKSQRPLGESSQLKWPSSQNLALKIQERCSHTNTFFARHLYHPPCLPLCKFSHKWKSTFSNVCLLTQGTCTSARMTKARVEENALARINLKIAAKLEAVHTYERIP